MTDYDAVIVGARVAGATTAMLLARAGHRVLLVDRDPLPSDAARGHFVYRDAPRRLHNWGLLERVIASNSPPVTRLLMHAGDFPLISENLSVDGTPWGIGPRRGILDKILLDAAVEAGAEVQDRVNVDDVLTDDGRVSGIRARSANTGHPLTIRAKLTIGADGRNSRIAQRVGAPRYERWPTLACWYFSYWSGVPMNGIELHMHHRRAIFAFPTNDDLTAVFVAMPIAEFASARSDPEAAITSALTIAPELADRVRAGRREERVYGTGDMPNFLRKPAGPGWALVGDAGVHKDPMLALGIAHALRDAELLASLAGSSFATGAPPDQALKAYEVRRNAATLPEYQENLQFARLEPFPPEVMRLRAALRDRPEDSRCFALANFNTIPREAFFNPTTLERLLGRSSAAA